MHRVHGGKTAGTRDDKTETSQHHPGTEGMIDDMTRALMTLDQPNPFYVNKISFKQGMRITEDMKAYLYFFSLLHVTNCMCIFSSGKHSGVLQSTTIAW